MPCSLFRYTESVVSKVPKSPTEAVETERYCFHTSLAGLELDEICTLDDKIVEIWVESTSNVAVFLGRFQIEMFHEMSHPDRTWTFRLRLRSLKIKPLKLRCSTVGRLSLEDGLLVGKMRMDGVRCTKIQFKTFSSCIFWIQLPAGLWFCFS